MQPAPQDRLSDHTGSVTSHQEDRMARRLWQRIRRGLERSHWPLAGLAALALILVCVLVIPKLLVGWDLGTPARTLTAADKAKAINDVRTTLLQGIGGAVILLGAYFTYRQLQTSRDQLQIAQQGQVTERFTRAIDQLGHAELDVRLGGIYALERIANDSPDDRATIAEVLTAYVRGHAPWPPRLDSQPAIDDPIEQVPELQLRAADVQAVLRVLARRRPPTTHGDRLDLQATDLRKAVLAGARLQRAYLSRANLQQADLRHAQLGLAELNGAQLQGANLYGAQLQNAFLSDAQLQNAKLEGGAQLQLAEFMGADLQRADLRIAQLQGAVLCDAQLQGAVLYGAQFQGAKLHGANLQGASLQGTQFKNAHADLRTTWPTGFNPHHAGVVLTDILAEAANEPEG
jgi:uncharacterized protein YjbI with pentapeptide repeats